MTMRRHWRLFSWRDVICYGFSVLDSVQSVVRYMGKRALYEA